MSTLPRSRGYRENLALSFSVGMCFQRIPFLFMLLLKCNAVRCLNKMVYFYRIASVNFGFAAILVCDTFRNLLISFVTFSFRAVFYV